MDRFAPEILKAHKGDIVELKEFIFAYGANEWNHLPVDEVYAHFDAIETGETEAVLVRERGNIIGFVSYITGNLADFSLGKEFKAPAQDEFAELGYLAEAVVSVSGRGLGTLLLKQAIDELKAKGVSAVYAKRHADNVASGRMMQKAGMEDVGMFDDPEVRPTGSRKTAVSRIQL